MTKDHLKAPEQLKKDCRMLMPSFDDFRIFGSRVLGEAGYDSNMDIILEVESLDRGVKERLFDIARKVGFGTHMVISLLIFNRDEIENSALKPSPVLTGIAEEGVRI